MLKAWWKAADMETLTRRVVRQHLPLAIAVVGGTVMAYGLGALVALKLGWVRAGAVSGYLVALCGLGIYFVGSFLRRFHQVTGRLNWLTHQAVWAAGVLQANGLHGDRNHEGDGPAAGNEGRWPWGAHHTEGLAHLEAAAKKWWTHYDPKEPDTAPTNEMVADWLIEERNVSKDKAKAIASLLRADGLRTGPRR